MNILVFEPLCLPENNSGAENHLHNILKELQLRGHKVIVLCQSIRAKTYDSIDYRCVLEVNVDHLVKWSDIIFSQLGFTDYGIKYSKKRPHVAIMPNSTFLNEKMNSTNTDLLVPISKFTEKEISFLEIDSVLVRPIIDVEKFSIDHIGDAITLINFDINKGPHVFWSLAKQMPDRKFIGVIGGYGEQYMPYQLPNVTIYKNSPNMIDIYKQTRILLIPSKEETWGIVGSEAACAGIPVIAHPANGLLESLGDSAIYVDRENILGYLDAIKGLDDLDEYNKYSSLVKKRPQMLNPTEEINNLERRLELLLTDRGRKRWFLFNNTKLK